MNDNEVKNPQPLAGADLIIPQAIALQEEYIQFEKLMEGLKMAREAARVLGLKRGDERWIFISARLNKMMDQLVVLGRGRVRPR